MTDAPDDFDLQPAEEDRDPKLELGPPIAADVLPSLPEDALDQFPMAFDRAPHPRERPARVDEQDSEGVMRPPRRPVGMVAAALLLGLACGFGGGYLVGDHRLFTAAQLAPAPAMIPVAPPAVPTQTLHEYTESAIGDSPSDATKDAGRDATRDAGRGADRDPVVEDANRESSPDEPTTLGRVLVQSTPSDAQVFVDGREEGRTPATIRELSIGEHRLRVVREGYNSENRRIVVTAAQPAQSVTVNMEHAHSVTASAPRTSSPPRPAVDEALVGVLDVESRPPGARVFLDGTLVGTTPVVEAHVGAGRHDIRLERNGYRRWGSSVWIVQSERNRITASLER